MRQVLAIRPSDVVDWASATRRRSRFYQEVTRRIGELPGVEGVAIGSFVPWRDAGSLGPGFPFTVEGYTPADGEENPHARMRIVAPGFFAVLGVPMLAGRDFTDDDRRGSEPVVIVSQSVAQRLFPNGDALNRHAVVDRSALRSRSPCRAASSASSPTWTTRTWCRRRRMTVYHPVQQMRRRRPPVRARGGRSVRARAAGDAHHPRDVGGPAGRARRDARGRARGSAGAGAAERLRRSPDSPASRC